MSSISSIATAGMQAAQKQLNVSAHNIANMQTPGFKRQQIEQTAQSRGGVAAAVKATGDSGGSLESDVVAQLQAKNSFPANLAVFKTSNQMAGALLNLKA